MRNIYYCIFIFLIVFISCNQKSGNSFNNALMNVGDVKSDLNSADINNTDEWSKEFFNKNLSNCLTRAAKKMVESEAYNYCNCMMDKIQNKYPNEKDAETKFSKEELSLFNAACISKGMKNENYKQDNSVTWSVSNQNKFKSDCKPTAVKALGEDGANSYCDCILKKLMQEYPDLNQVDKLSKTYLNNLASNCLQKGD